MDLDEIQSVQSRERQTDSLQQLRDSFYEEAGEFVRALREERERAAERADDPFDAPQVNRLSDDIATAEQTLEAIYERRVGKIVKMASLAAADMPTEDEGLTTEERDLFESLVGSIEQSRNHVFDVLEGETTGGNPDVDTSPSNETDLNRGQPVPEDESQSIEQSPEQRSEPADHLDPESVSAADLMGADGGTPTGGSSEDSSADGEAQSRPVPDEQPPQAAVGESPRRDGGTAPVEPSSEASGMGESTADDDNTSTRSDPTVERTTVRIMDDVGEILGVDDRAYDLTADDVVTLPATNADPLVEQGAAERLE
ncbi:DNA replication complex GINS family protein [Halorhabdus rudnickae]|uniref:DNA replication complex GINS family protein n=1 Tax=Halorhabdus rudnickae TaxID=1775544 RepID=UPI00108320FC|nr:DNA replication complex GINS family protein [Halorhabdus rudnickae]